MSILTKICVVLVLVVSVAASGVFLRVVSVQRSWRGAYDRQLERADVADLTARNAQIALQKKIEAVEVASGEIRTLKKALADEKVAHTADKTAAARAQALLQGNFDSLKASFAEQTENWKASLAMQKQLSADKAALLKAVTEANDAARGLKKDFDEASVQIRRLETMVKHYALLIKDLRAENKELQTEIATLRSKVKDVTAASGGLGDDAPPPVPAGQDVSGKVTAVSDGVASINIGRAKGIKEKMVLTIYRGGKFVARLRIDLVEPDSAAGVILDKKLDAMQGDEVATGLK